MKQDQDNFISNVFSELSRKDFEPDPSNPVIKEIKKAETIKSRPTHRRVKTEF